MHALHNTSKLKKHGHEHDTAILEKLGHDMARTRQLINWQIHILGVYIYIKQFLC